MASGKRRIAILGSTGSIGTQALDVISQHEDRCQVELLTANNNSRLLIEQARRFNPSAVVICNPDRYDEVAAALDPLYIKVFTGIDSICELLKDPQIDIVLTAMVGFSGLRPTISAMVSSTSSSEAGRLSTIVPSRSTVMSSAMRKIMRSTPVCVSFRPRSRASSTGPMSVIVVRTG